MKSNLGVTVSKVRAELERFTAFFDDPITRGSGCADEFAPGMRRRTAVRIEAILRDAGYDNYCAFVNDVEERTTPKWSYFCSGIDSLFDNGGEFFEPPPVQTCHWSSRWACPWCGDHTETDKELEEHQVECGPARRIRDVPPNQYI